MNTPLMEHCTKNEVSSKDFFSKCDQICRKLWIWSHLLLKSLMENFLFCVMEAEMLDQKVMEDFLLYNFRLDHKTKIRDVLFTICYS